MNTPVLAPHPRDNHFFMIFPTFLTSFFSSHIYLQRFIFHRPKKKKNHKKLVLITIQQSVYNDYIYYYILPMMILEHRHRCHRNGFVGIKLKRKRTPLSRCSASYSLLILNWYFNFIYDIFWRKKNQKILIFGMISFFSIDLRCVFIHSRNWLKQTEDKEEIWNALGRAKAKPTFSLVRCGHSGVLDMWRLFWPTMNSCYAVNPLVVLFSTKRLPYFISIILFFSFCRIDIPNALVTTVDKVWFRVTDTLNWYHFLSGRS